MSWCMENCGTKHLQVNHLPPRRKVDRDAKKYLYDKGLELITSNTLSIVYPDFFYSMVPTGSHFRMFSHGKFNVCASCCPLLRTAQFKKASP